MRAGAAKKPAAYPKIETARVVVLITPEQLDRIDNWGIGKGKQNRTEAIRSLVDLGLEAERDAKACNENSDEGGPRKLTPRR